MLDIFERLFRVARPVLRQVAISVATEMLRRSWNNTAASSDRVVDPPKPEVRS
jgi:hypothetical protein